MKSGNYYYENNELLIMFTNDFYFHNIFITNLIEFHESLKPSNVFQQVANFLKKFNKEIYLILNNLN